MFTRRYLAKGTQGGAFTSGMLKCFRILQKFFPRPLWHLPAAVPKSMPIFRHLLGQHPAARSVDLPWLPTTEEQITPHLMAQMRNRNLFGEETLESPLLRRCTNMAGWSAMLAGSLARLRTQGFAYLPGGPQGLLGEKDSSSGPGQRTCSVPSTTCQQAVAEPTFKGSGQPPKS